MKTAKPLRELPASSAWNDAARRSTVLSIGGFFIPNLLANFGVIPQLHQSFQFMPGVCGAAGVFSISLALFIGQYHRKLLQGIALGITGLVLPYSVTWFWFRITHPSAPAGLLQLCGPTAIIAIGTYLVLMRWHARLSSLTTDVLAEQLNSDEYGEPKAKWEQLTYRVRTIVGLALILLLILGALHRAIVPGSYVSI
jgi:nitrate/nitrite transporter NarK